jgi:hypothetical protein
MAKTSLSQKIRDHFKDHPTDKVADVARALGLKYQFVYIVKRKMDVVNAPVKGHRVNRAGKILMQASVTPQDEVDEYHAKLKNPAPYTPMQVDMLEPKSDPVNHPAHYKYGGIETIDFIEAKELGYNLGNVVKYVTRADHKGNRKEDLEKALWYLTREINSIK